MLPSNNKLRIIVLGYIIRGPLGGMAWHHLQYVTGLAKLGHDVFFIEDSDDYASCYNPLLNTMGIDPSYGLEFADQSFRRLDMENRWSYYDAYSGNWLGPLGDRAAEVCRSADVVLNVSGVNPLRSWTGNIPVRVLIDTDPVFTQVRHLTDPLALRLAQEHTAFFSFGENIGLPGCTVPVDSFPWQPTRQPIDLEAWRQHPPNSQGAFSTVMQWDSYPAREYQGQVYGMKSSSFMPYLDIPQQVQQTIELALGGSNAPRHLLSANGWTVLEPQVITNTPWSYQQYIQRSKAEFSIAKHGYVVSKSGWFSERTAAYLATGRPAVVQDTGFTRWLDHGLGLIAFSTVAEAIHGIKEINGNYDQHCKAARHLGATYFDAREVLSSLIERAHDFNTTPNATTLFCEQRPNR
jgi:hypothetical protein